ncbi:MAG: hypothetical protein U0401_26985 [Anaerolineae bacterium]
MLEWAKPDGAKQVILTKREADGRCLRETALIPVTWTVDAGVEDQQVSQRYGQKALRQVRVQRLLLEALEQGAAFH